MGAKPRAPIPAKEVAHRVVILQVRPKVANVRAGWPTIVSESVGDAELIEWASINPYDPPGWSIGVDQDCALHSCELFEEGITIAEHIEFMKSEWYEENGPDDESTEKEVEWEFQLLEVE